MKYLKAMGKIMREEKYINIPVCAKVLPYLTMGISRGLTKREKQGADRIKETFGNVMYVPNLDLKLCWPLAWCNASEMMRGQVITVYFKA